MSREHPLRHFAWQSIGQVAAEAGEPNRVRAAEQDAERADAVAQAQARGNQDAVRLLTQGWAPSAHSAEHL